MALLEIRQRGSIIGIVGVTNYFYKATCKIGIIDIEMNVKDWETINKVRIIIYLLNSVRSLTSIGNML